MHLQTALEEMRKAAHDNGSPLVWMRMEKPCWPYRRKALPDGHRRATSRANQLRTEALNK